MGVAIALHALLFYLFRVVYPPSRRLVRQPEGIVLLTAGTPGAVPILHEISDQIPGFEGGLEELTTHGVANNFVADYVASFRGYEPDLAIPEFRRDSRTLPFLSPPGAVVLPPTRFRAPSASFSLPPDDAPLPLAKPTWTLKGSLVDRELLRPPRLSPEDVAALADRPDSYRIRIGVDQFGVIAFTGPSAIVTSSDTALVDLDPEVEARLRSIVRPMRFAPAPGVGDGVSRALQFGRVEIDWSEAEKHTGTP